MNSQYFVFAVLAFTQALPLAFARSDEVSTSVKRPFSVSCDTEGNPTEASISQATDESFSEIEELDKLTQLAILDSKLSPMAFAEIAKCDSLRTLILFGTEVDDAAMIHISTMKLEVLYDIRGEKLTGKGLALLKKMASLEVLRIGNCNTRSGDFTFLKDLTNLRILAITEDTFGDADAESIPRAALRNLNLQSPAVTPAVIDKFTAFPTLGILSLNPDKFDESHEKLLRAKLPGVVIDIRRTKP